MLDLKLYRLQLFGCQIIDHSLHNCGQAAICMRFFFIGTGARHCGEHIFNEIWDAFNDLPFISSTSCSRRLLFSRVLACNCAFFPYDTICQAFERVFSVRSVFNRPCGYWLVSPRTSRVVKGQMVRILRLGRATRPLLERHGRLLWRDYDNFEGTRVE